MKNFILLLLFCLMSKSAISQNLDNHFPMAVGNYWVYHNFDHNIWEYTDSFFVKVLGVEIKANNKSYYAVSESYLKFSDTPNRYYRIDDSSNVYQYFDTTKSECLLYKLGVKYGDTWQSCGFLSSTTYGMMNFHDTLLLPYRKVIQFFDTIPRIPYTSPLMAFYFDKGVGISRILHHRINITSLLKRFFVATNKVEKERIHEPDPSYRLSQNYPNPFNPTTKISYSLSTSGFATLKIYDILGQELVTLVNEHKKPGSYETTFNANSTNKILSSGVYFYKLQVNNFTECRKMVFAK